MINSELKRLLENPKMKFTVILGSGFHRQGLGDYSILSDWNTMLSRLTSSVNLTGKFTLDFERIILERKESENNSISASNIEKAELKELSKVIREEQNYVLRNLDRFNYPNLFIGDRISDVVSLNFDSVAEKLCSIQDEVEKLSNKSSFNLHNNKNKLSDSFITQNTSFKKYVNSVGQEIRFWHPHGTIDNSKHMVLGISNYSKLISTLVRIRNHFKANEDFNEPDKELTWFSKIVQNPVLILGASMSEMEWAMWSAIVYKSRNYANSDNTKQLYPIFQMKEGDPKNCNLDYWIKPLFTDVMTHNEQWEELKKLLIKK